MARPIVLSNGTMHVGINLFGMVHDFYYPYVGFENHAMANNMRHRVGIWTEGHFSWLDDGKWQFEIDYFDQAMIGSIIAHNEELGIRLEFQDLVDSHYNAFTRNIHVINEFDREREIRVFLHQVFLISNSLNVGTAQYLPGEPAILHYKGRRAFVIGAVDAEKKKPFDQYSIGVYGIEGKEGTFRDAEDGELMRNNVEHGSVDSVVGFNLNCEPHGSSRLFYWIAAGKSQQEALSVHHAIREDGLFERAKVTQQHWHQWLEPAEKFISGLEPDMQAPFRKSLLIAKSHIDKHGGVIASTDTTMRNYSRDAYAYCWPRDASFVLWPLLRLGYRDELLAFFRFCRNALHPEGYLMHKYQPDGALGSSWHPYIFGTRNIAPIQEDETGIVIFLFGQYYQMTGDEHALHEFYHTLIKPAADFMCSYIDNTTKLPRATYDLWEQSFLTTTYTTGVVYGALLAAAKLAEEAEQSQDAVRWQTVAQDMREAAQQKLFNPDKQYFYRGFVHHTTDGKSAMLYDDTIDMSSFYGSFMFGLFDLKSEQLTAAYDTLQKVFKASETEVMPLPRYEHDQYNLKEPESLGNPWFITTLWLAQYYLETDRPEAAKKIVQWVQSRMLPSGVLSEQINPYTHKFISVAPLAWSQAEFLNTVIDLVSDPQKAIKAAERQDATTP